MATNSTRPRKWADLLVIFASVASLANAMWGPTIFTSMMHAPQGDRGVGYNWAAFGIAGILGVLGVFLTFRRPAIAKIPVIVAGLLLIAVPFTYSRPLMMPEVTAVVLGVLLLVAVPFFGPMPAPSRGQGAPQPAARK